MKYRKNEQRLSIYLFITIVITIVMSVISFFYYQRNLQNTLDQKLQKDLSKCSDDGVFLTNKMLDSIYQELASISLFYSFLEEDSTTEVMDQLNESNKVYKIGIGDLKGNVYFTGQRAENISKNPYFQNLLEGKRYISNVHHNDYFNRAIIFTEPIIKENTLVGFLFAIYNTSYISSYVESSKLPEIGTRFIIDDDGHIINNRSEFKSYNTFYDLLYSMGSNSNLDAVELVKKIKNNEQDYIKYTNNNKTQYIYYTPLKINNWKLISIIQNNEIEKEYNYIIKESLKLILLNILLIGIILSVLFIIYKNSQKYLYFTERDGLTNLYNKTTAKKKCEYCLQNDGKKQRHACFFIDLDNFKQLNDNLGHKAGDELIVDFAKELSKIFRSTDIVSRFGGDEFVIFMKNIKSNTDVIRKANCIENILENLDNTLCSTSVGISFYPEHASTYKELLDTADKALYKAKKAGKNQYYIYQKTDTK